jgi:hypothetical protein
MALLLSSKQSTSKTFDFVSISKFCSTPARLTRPSGSVDKQDYRHNPFAFHVNRSGGASRVAFQVQPAASHRLSSVDTTANSSEGAAAVGKMADLKKGEDQRLNEDVPKRRILLILHGKRIYDEQIREDVKAIQEEGHDVSVLKHYATRM